MSCNEAHPGICAHKDNEDLPSISQMEAALRKQAKEGTFCKIASGTWELYALVGHVRLRRPPLALFAQCDFDNGTGICTLKRQHGMLLGLNQWMVAKLIICSGGEPSLTALKTDNIANCLSSVRVLDGGHQVQLMTTQPQEKKQKAMPHHRAFSMKWTRCS